MRLTSRAARSLVTGGAGFIGSHIVRRSLRSARARVRVLDNFSTGQRANLATVADRIELIEGDIVDAASGAPGRRRRRVCAAPGGAGLGARVGRGAHAQLRDQLCGPAQPAAGRARCAGAAAGVLVLGRRLWRPRAAAPRGAGATRALALMRRPNTAASSSCRSFTHA